jgi:hypothetical protein
MDALENQPRYRRSKDFVLSSPLCPSGPRPRSNPRPKTLLPLYRDTPPSLIRSEKLRRFNLPKTPLASLHTRDKPRRRNGYRTGNTLRNAENLMFSVGGILLSSVRVKHPQEVRGISIGRDSKVFRRQHLAIAAQSALNPVTGG